MAFAGYTVARKNVFNTSVCDSKSTYEDTEVRDIVSTLMDENRSGDVIMVWEEDTEDSGYLLVSYFNHPFTGWCKE